MTSPSVPITDPIPLPPPPEAPPLPELSPAPESVPTPTSKQPFDSSLLLKGGVCVTVTVCLIGIIFFFIGKSLANSAVTNNFLTPSPSTITNCTPTITNCVSVFAIFGERNFIREQEQSDWWRHSDIPADQWTTAWQESGDAMGNCKGEFEAALTAAKNLHDKLPRRNVTTSTTSSTTTTTTVTTTTPLSQKEQDCLDEFANCDFYTDLKTDLANCDTQMNYIDKYSGECYNMETCNCKIKCMDSDVYYTVMHYVIDRNNCTTPAVK